MHPPHVPLHYRFKHVCYQTCYKKWEQHAFEHVEKIYYDENAAYREYDAHHPVEGIWLTFHLIVLFV